MLPLTNILQVENIHKGTVLKQRCPRFKSNEKEIFEKTVLVQTLEYDICHGQTVIIKKESILHFTSTQSTLKSKAKQNFIGLFQLPTPIVKLEKVGTNVILGMAWDGDTMFMP